MCLYQDTWKKSKSFILLERLLQLPFASRADPYQMVLIDSCLIKSPFRRYESGSKLAWNHRTRICWNGPLFQPSPDVRPSIDIKVIMQINIASFWCHFRIFKIDYPTTLLSLFDQLDEFLMAHEYPSLQMQVQEVFDCVKVRNRFSNTN